MTFLLSILAVIGQASPFDQFSETFSDQRKGIQYLEAKFEQESVTPDETSLFTGTVVFTQPRRMLMRYDDPPLMYLFTDTAAYEYDADIAQLKIYGLKDMPEMEALFLGFDNEPKRLQDAYHVEVLPPSAETDDALALRLRPKPLPDAEPLFESATLLLRRDDFLPYEVRVRHGEDSTNTIHIRNFETEDESHPSKADIHVPEGTTVILNDRFDETVGPGGKTFPEPDPDPPVQTEPLDEP